MGDVIKDSYYHGVCDRISPEAPVPVVKIAKGTFRLGGAGNVVKILKIWNRNLFVDGSR